MREVDCKLVRGASRVFRHQPLRCLRCFHNLGEDNRSFNVQLKNVPSYAKPLCYVLKTLFFLQSSVHERTNCVQDDQHRVSVFLVVQCVLLMALSNAIGQLLILS
jgi:hypothetical protein